MKKTFRFFGFPLFLMVMIPIILSCNSDDEPKPEPKSYFHIENAGFKISAEAQTLEIRIHTNINVTTKVLRDTGNWFSILYAGSVEDCLNYRVTVNENTSPEERTVQIMFEPAAGTVITPDAEMGGNMVVITQAGGEP